MAEADAVFRKVTAFVTRPGAQLLCFDHPTAGRQLPAGSVEPHEPIEAAVRREVFEESGIRTEGPATWIGTLDTFLGPDRAVMGETVALFSDEACRRPVDQARPRVLRRGLTVEVVTRGVTTVRLRYRERDWTQTPPALQFEIEGWAPAGAVLDRIHRTLFHVPLADWPADRWEHAADGHVFRFSWVPLVPRPTLAVSQQPWLDAAYDALLEQARRGT